MGELEQIRLKLLERVDRSMVLSRVRYPVLTMYGLGGRNCIHTP